MAEREWTQDEIDDDVFRDEDECDCVEAELDWQGRIHCHACGSSWWATPDEVKAHRDMERHAYAYYEREMRGSWWDRLRHWFRQLRAPKSNIGDDEIPF